MEAESQVEDMLSVIPEDSAESLAESAPATPQSKAIPVARKGGETLPESVSIISTRRSSLRSPNDYSQFEGLIERVSERVDKQNCSCACEIF